MFLNSAIYRLCHQQSSRVKGGQKIFLFCCYKKLTFRKKIFSVSHRFSTLRYSKNDDTDTLNERYSKKYCHGNSCLIINYLVSICHNFETLVLFRLLNLQVIVGRWLTNSSTCTQSGLIEQL